MATQLIIMGYFFSIGQNGFGFAMIGAFTLNAVVTIIQLLWKAADK